MIKRVLIANRGAIAVRILRTLKARGIESVAVYAEADYASAHVDLADRAVSLGDGTLAETYLNGEALLAIAREGQVDAIHPGYGFLSENPAFAEAAEAAGLIFLGPTAAQINAFGLKHEARALAESAGVPLLPGSDVLSSVEEALQFAEETGYPVILKSSAGGGGIGMQRCETADALAKAFASVAQQAQTNFGDARLFLERFVDAARHVEVQILGNGQGDVVVLGDRDCSLQRRNQKIIEEAPAPGLPDAVREAMHEAAGRLMASVNYRSAGTVEFLYDAAREAVYFLEVNARLQVEHGVTEMVTGLDIVDWMLRIGEGERALPETPTPQGAALQARLYAEDPERAFRPAPGLITHLKLPEAPDRTRVRVDSWVSPGLTVPAAYDPMLAKLLVWAPTREAALPALSQALQGCEVGGIPTNLPFLHAALGLESFQRVTHHTKTADGVTLPGQSIEVLSPGTQTTIQDVRGRLGYWHVGVPPSGAFDSRALAHANRCLGNDENLPGLEMVVEGPTLKFTAARRIALSGAALTAQLDGVPVPLNQAVTVDAGQTLSLKGIGAQGDGLRAYLAVEGGFAITPVLGSTATFELGGFGGHGGRALRTGDVLPLSPRPKARPDAPLPLPPSLADRTTIRVVQGPLLAPDFLTPDYLDTFYASEWEVHYNSSRTGIRLLGPKPEWVREDGGDAGLHPSNVHDNAYAFGAIDFTGDMPIILGPDGPSLGGFVCPAAVAEVDRWKLGQLRPGDKLRFEPITLEEAQALLEAPRPAQPSPAPGRWRESAEGVVLLKDLTRELVVRAAGDRFLLVELGPTELDLQARIKIEALHRWLAEQGHPSLEEMTPGVRSLQLRVPLRAPRGPILALIEDGLRAVEHSDALTLPSRIVELPLAWDDPATQEATARYMQSVRDDAPWCPRNLEFIRRINGLPDEQAVKDIVLSASYLVLGLGDVYLGAPVATPLDPRHRLVTTKYNPARTWTPENAVGIGGAYLCIYGMEGPGGYQFVGRTIQVWNRYGQGSHFEKPWLLRPFDQLRFYEVSNEELLEMRRAFPLGRLPLRITETTFSPAEYDAFLKREGESIAAFRRTQQQAFNEERGRWSAQDSAGASAEPPAAAPAVTVEAGFTAVESPVAGSLWKHAVTPGAWVEAGEPVALVESMKTEIAVLAPEAGRLASFAVEPGTPVTPGSTIALLESA